MAPLVVVTTAQVRGGGVCSGAGMSIPWNVEVIARAGASPMRGSSGVYLLLVMRVGMILMNRSRNVVVHCWLSGQVGSWIGSIDCGLVNGIRVGVHV